MQLKKIGHKAVKSFLKSMAAKKTQMRVLKTAVLLKKNYLILNKNDRQANLNTWGLTSSLSENVTAAQQQEYKIKSSSLQYMGSYVIFRDLWCRKKNKGCLAVPLAAAQQQQKVLAEIKKSLAANAAIKPLLLQQKLIVAASKQQQVSLKNNKFSAEQLKKTLLTKKSSNQKKKSIFGYDNHFLFKPALRCFLFNTQSSPSPVLKKTKKTAATKKFVVGSASAAAQQKQKVPSVQLESRLLTNNTGIYKDIVHYFVQTTKTNCCAAAALTSGQKRTSQSVLFKRNIKYRTGLWPTQFFKKEYELESYHRSNQDTCLIHKPVVKEGNWIQTGDLLADCASSVGGELAIGSNIIVAYMPWEGYNYEDAILINERLVYDDIYTSIHIERYEVLTKDTKLGSEQITREIPDVNENEISHLDKDGIAKIGSWVEEGDILVGKIAPFDIKKLTPQQKLLYKIFDKELSKTKDTSLRAPKGIKANVINVNILARSCCCAAATGSTILQDNKNPKLNSTFQTSLFKTPRPVSSSERLAKKTKLLARVKEGPIKQAHIYLAEKRKMQVGDKMAGRHGNKGIISRIMARQDMPFLPDGTLVDIVLNPLGVPSRMNVGQIYECLLGLAGRYLGEHYKIPPFDEKYGADASRSFVLSKLYEARQKTGLKWLLDPNYPGKIKIFDGRTSESFNQAVTVGISYVLKLVHMVDDKLHMRSTGPYSLVTQQPLRGRSKQGGQRLGEMEVWAIEGYGAAFVLSEMLTIKSDDMTGRQNLWKNLIENNEILLGSPESFKVLVCELQALCLDIGLFRKNKNTLDTTAQQQEENLLWLRHNKEPSAAAQQQDSNLKKEASTASNQNLIEIDSLLHLA
uniref:DNA-directed RNA polymerase n=1 Tax=Pandorina morum TaxID=33099 RepID=A0A6C0RWM7_PANMO|nr:beta subunit of RNA polymerase [Pandorina morum]